MKPSATGLRPPRRTRSVADTLMALFCALTLGFLVYRDLAIPEIRDVEVWLGFEVRGIWAQITAPIHWAIFGAGSLAFWRAWPPVWRIAVGYALYVAFSHLVWNLTSDAGRGLPAGIAQFVLFSIPALAIELFSRSSLNRVVESIAPPVG